MLFHGRQNARVSLHASGVVVTDVGADHVDQFLLVCEATAIIPLPLQNTPEALHWPVINTMGYSGHALCHTGLFQLVVEGTVCVLKTTVRMENGVGIRIVVYCLVKGFEYEWIVISLADYERDNASVVKIQNGTEIDFMDLSTSYHLNSVTAVSHFSLGTWA